MLEIVGQVVEQHIAQPRPDHQAENNVGCHILDLVGGEFKTVLPFDPVQDQKKGDGKGNDIHEPMLNMTGSIVCGKCCHQLQNSSIICYSAPSPEVKKYNEIIFCWAFFVNKTWMSLDENIL
jgi:hypothetical protein